MLGFRKRDTGRPYAVAVILALAAALGAFWFAAAQADERPQAVPHAIVDEHPAAGAASETAVLAGGCFWGVEGVFQHVKGVKAVTAGYSGGSAATANYQAVSSETTGHAESVEIVFNPQVISYGEILRVFFSVAHDPTQLNRQGPDTGTSYRSNIFYTTPEQQRIAKAYIAQLDKAQVFHAPIVTRVDPLKAFYRAESYHQNFLIRNPQNPYIVINDLPKIAALQKLLPEDYQSKTVS